MKNHNTPSDSDTEVNRKDEEEGLHAIPSSSRGRLKQCVVINTASVEPLGEVEYGI